MNVKRFVANTSREALRKVRDALGAEAIILSNRSLDHGVEILAMSSQDMASLAEPVSDGPAVNEWMVGGMVRGGINGMAPSIQPPPAEERRRGLRAASPGDGHAPIDNDAALIRETTRARASAASLTTRRSSLFGDSINDIELDIARKAQLEIEEAIAIEAVAAAPASAFAVEPLQIEAVMASASGASATPAVTPTVMRRRADIHQAAGLADALEASRQVVKQTARTLSAIDSTEMQAMMQEIRHMRGMLQTQLAEMSWGNLNKREPARAEILQELLVAGFSPAMARHLIEQLPAGHSKVQGMNWVKTVLTRNLVTIDSEEEMIAKGGVYALVGPTGVGKTTTTAKLAARVVMRHGANRLALITTDGYRIGGHEQLRIYGKILGVMVHSVKDEADLRIALNELQGKHTVLIDTAGVGQRDQMVAEQVAMLSGPRDNEERRVKRLLCLPATATGATLNEVVDAYQAKDGQGLDGCIITKLDEAASLGSVLDTILRQKLNLYYIANGQRVPEDLHQANRDYLIDKAFKLKRDAAYFSLNEDELPLIMAQTYAGQETASVPANNTATLGGDA